MGIFLKSSTVTPTLTPTVTPPGMAIAAPKTMMSKGHGAPIILIPQPSDDANDPLVSPRSISHLKHTTEQRI